MVSPEDVGWQLQEVQRNLDIASKQCVFRVGAKTAYNAPRVAPATIAPTHAYLLSERDCRKFSSIFRCNVNYILFLKLGQIFLSIYINVKQKEEY